MALLAKGSKAVNTARESGWFDELDARHGSLHAFVNAALEADDGATIARLGAVLSPYWARRATDGSE